MRPEDGYCIFPYAGMTRIRFTGEGCTSPSLSRNGSGTPKIHLFCGIVILPRFPLKIKPSAQKTP